MKAAGAKAKGMSDNPGMELSWRGEEGLPCGDWEETLPSTCSSSPAAGRPRDSSMAGEKSVNQEQVAVAVIFHTCSKDTLEMAFAAGCCWWL